MSGPVLREVIRDFMANEFRQNKTTEFTVGDIASGLQVEGHSFSNKQVANSLQDLKRLNKAIQTRKVPNATGGAMYWALISVLEAATQPEMSKEEAAEVTGNADVPATRKPRHDDPSHVEHVLAKQLAEFEERLTKQFAVMQTDFEQAVKSKLKAAMAEASPAPSANAGLTEHDTANIKTIVEAAMSTVHADAVERTSNQNIMSFADIGAKLSEENTGHMHKVISIAQDFLTTYEATTAMMRNMLKQAVGEDDLKEQGFTKGFAAGWSAAEEKFNAAIREALMEKFAQHKAHSEQQSVTDANNQSLTETLRKLGAV